MAADAGLLFVAAAESVEALRVADGATAWIAPRVTTVAPLVARAGWVIAVTETEIVAIRATDGQVAWRRAAGGVELAPDIDGDKLYAGATDGRVLALTLSSGAEVWEKFLPLGVTAIAARGGRVYAGGGDKQFYCLDGRSARHEMVIPHRSDRDRPHCGGRRSRLFRGAQQRGLRAGSIEREPAVEDRRQSTAASPASSCSATWCSCPRWSLA